MPTPNPIAILVPTTRGPGLPALPAIPPLGADGVGGFAAVVSALLPSTPPVANNTQVAEPSPATQPGPGIPPTLATPLGPKPKIAEGTDRPLARPRPTPKPPADEVPAPQVTVTIPLTEHAMAVPPLSAEFVPVALPVVSPPPLPISEPISVPADTAVSRASLQVDPSMPAGELTHSRTQPGIPLVERTGTTAYPVGTPMPDAAMPPIHAAPKPQSAAPAAPAAEQLAPVLVTIARTPAGTQHMTLQLQPEALGHLQITIDRTANAATQIRIEVERPETLAMLRHDSPQLQRALDQTSLQRDPINLTFHATASVTAAPAAQDTGQTSSQFLGTGQPHQGFADGQNRRTPLSDIDAVALSSEPSPSPEASNRSVRSGIDITA